MARRIDFYDDPDAPAASSVVPSANMVAVNDAGRLLLILRGGNGNWALPVGRWIGGVVAGGGGAGDVGETGIEAEITGLVGIYTDPRHVILYTSNNEVRQEFSVVFTARRLVASLRPATSRGRCAG